MALIDSTHDRAYVQMLSAISMMAPISIFLMTLGFAWITKPCTPTSNAPPRAKTLHYFATIVLTALVVWVAAQGWRATVADISAAVAQSATSKNQSALGEELIEQAVSIMPYERRYRRQQIFDLLGQAATDIRALKLDPARYPAVARNLSIAEDKARESLWKFPRDPWALLALANVLQFRALHLLRPFDQAMGERAAKEAREVFTRAHEMFPSQPLLLRNWAQLEFDEGQYRQTSHLLDLMESLIPGEIEAYSERIALSRQLGDFATIADTLDRASRTLDPKSFAHLKNVASMQQN
jgi:tetratricopeptide (TPR) repeat protein